ncbi:phosphopentomutase [Lasius niger]|uniref:Phosphopentomutase n=1 Tax=Lasius niger TaxID=67767 RepID=A0A0J7K454_LASNI|nr:phosphopentomutase [Lasius niger]
MDLESVPIDNVAFVSTPSFSVLKASSLLTTKKSLDNSRLDVVKTKNSKRKIVEKESLSVSTDIGSELSEGDRSKPGKASARPLDGSDIFDFPLESNRYDNISRGPFDVVIQTEHSSTSIDPICVSRLLYSIFKKGIVKTRKIGYS